MFPACAGGSVETDNSRVCRPTCGSLRRGMQGGYCLHDEPCSQGYAPAESKDTAKEVKKSYLWCNFHTLGVSHVFRDYMYCSFSQICSSCCLHNTNPFDRCSVPSNVRTGADTYRGHRPTTQ